MITLKDNKLTTKKHGVVYCEAYVKKAIDELNRWCDINSTQNPQAHFMRIFKNKIKEILGDFKE